MPTLLQPWIKPSFRHQSAVALLSNLCKAGALHGRSSDQAQHLLRSCRCHIFDCASSLAASCASNGTCFKLCDCLLDRAKPLHTVFTQCRQTGCVGSKMEAFLAVPLPAWLLPDILRSELLTHHTDLLLVLTIKQMLVRCQRTNSLWNVLPVADVGITQCRSRWKCKPS